MGGNNRYIYGEGGDISNIPVEQVVAATMEMLIRPASSEKTT